MPDWPSSLCYDDQYSYSFENENVFTEYATGNVRNRNYGGMNNDIHSYSMVLDNSGLDTFEFFFLNTLNNGELSFTGPYFVGSFKDEGELRFIGGYSKEYLTVDYWRVNFTLRLYNRDLTREQSIYDTVISNGGFG